VAVYEKVDLAVLRRVWLNLDLLNLDLVWAAALLVAGALTLVL